jgi:hypothetical protein
MTNTYTFPTTKRVLKKFGFKNAEARRELHEAISQIYLLSASIEEDTLLEIVGKIRRATLVEEGIEK